MADLRHAFAQAHISLKVDWAEIEFKPETGLPEIYIDNQPITNTKTDPVHKLVIQRTVH